MGRQVYMLMRAAAGACVALAVGFALPAAGEEAYDQHFRYVGNYPSEANPGYHEDVQGITHDNTHWYITRATKDEGQGWIWRIPVEVDLASPDDPALVNKESTASVPELVDNGYWHLGDLSYYEYPQGSGVGYLLIPVQNETLPPILAVFRANSALDYVGSAPLSEQGSAGWVAVDPSGTLYTANWGYQGNLITYTLDWTQLASGNVVITSHSTVPMFDESGFPLSLDSMQGGVISPNGSTLYLSTGYINEFGGGLPPYMDLWGIHVFDTGSWRRIARSTNGTGLFNFEFDPLSLTLEEPEGITIWDLDDGRAPGVSGQLHVLLLDNDIFAADDVYIKHYTNVTHVDAAYSGTEDGTISKPYNTVGEALAFYGSYDWWTGGKISIKAGTYPEVLTLNKRMQVRGRSGAATVGITGQFRFNAGGLPVGAINVYPGGAVKLH